MTPREYRYYTTAQSLVPGFVVLTPEGRKVKVERSYCLSSTEWFVRFDTGNMGETVPWDKPYTVVSDN